MVSTNCFNQQIRNLLKTILKEISKFFGLQIHGFHFFFGKTMTIMKMPLRIHTHKDTTYNFPLGLQNLLLKVMKQNKNNFRALSNGFSKTKNEYK